MKNSNDTKLYLSILDQFPNPIWRSGTDAKCDYFNKAWLEFTGRTIEQEMGDGWAEGVHPDDLDMCIKIYKEAFDARESFDMEYRLMHNDGTYHWISDYGSPFFENEEFLGYIGSCYDNTEEKKRMEEIEKLNDVLTGRELRMVELKEKIAELEEQLAKK